MTKFQELDIRTELFFSNQWNSITGDTRGGKTRGFGIDIERGRDDEASQVDPTSVELTLNNCNGRYSPRNPLSPLFGLIGRNTPLRVSVGEPYVGKGDGNETLSTSHVAPSVTAAQAGLLICAWGARPVVDYTVPGSMTSGPETDGDLSTTVSAIEAVTSGPTGTRTATASGSSHSVTGSVLLNGDSVSVEETFSGVGVTEAASDVTLTTAATTQAGWWLVAIQRWAWITDVTTRFMPDAPQDNDGGWIPLADSEELDADTGFVHRLRMWARRVTISGEQAVTFYGMPTTSLDNHAHLYVLSGVTDWFPRATVEVSEWPPRWDVSGHASWVPIQGNGVVRRLGQGEKPAHSALRRAVAGRLIRNLESGGTPLGPLAYWPLENSRSAVKGVNAIMGGSPFRPNRSDRPIGFGERDDVPGGSDTLPSIAFPFGGGNGNVIDLTSGEDWAVTFLIKVEDGSTDVFLLDITFENGPVEDATYTFLGTTVNLAVNGGSTSIGTINHTTFDGTWQWIELSAVQQAGSVFYRMTAYSEDGIQLLALTSFGTVSGASSGNITNVKITGNQTDPMSVGHIVVWPSNDPEPLELAREAINGYKGEPAGRRVERLCGEELIPFHPVGNLDASTFMGPQSVATFLNLLRECETTDLGVLFEHRQAIALGYRTRRSLYNQISTLALDHDSCHLALPFEPTEDDKLTRNDVTVTQAGGEGEGASARVIETEGPMSIDSIGRYDTDVNINVASELDLPDQASFRLHLGTVDEARYPEIRIKNIVPPNCPLDEDLSGQAASVDLGDKITIDNPPPQLPPNQIQALAQGYREHLDLYEWDLRFNTSPASPFTIGQRAEDPADPGPIDPVRRDTAGSQLDTQFVAGTDTSMDVETTQGPLWGVTGTSNMHFPFDVYISGARVRVTGVGAAVGQVQTFTVEQIIVNNVNKTIEAGEPVRLWQPATRGL